MPDYPQPSQPCDSCGKPVMVNAVSPSECFCSADCQEAKSNPIRSAKTEEEFLKAFHNHEFVMTEVWEELERLREYEFMYKGLD